MRTAIVLSFLITVALGYGCRSETGPQALHRQHCGNCHLAPSPTLLPRSVWESNVLPEMAARMGMATMGYDPMIELGEVEYELARASGIYPEQPTIAHDDWLRLKQYILEQAPDSLAAPTLPRLRALENFRPHSLTLRPPGTLVTFLASDSLLIGTGRGQLLDTAGRVIASGRAPIVHQHGDLYLEIGDIYPTEAHNGRLYRDAPGGPELLIDSLHRPTYFLSEDLDGDGRDEIVICEYGHFTGALSILNANDENGYGYRRLSGVAGATRVVAEDLNEDGRKDLVYLHAQGDEGIDVLYQQADGSFKNNSLLRFESVWGTSWFELIDFDRDGDLDLLTAHGDNADYSNVIKPYHGLRIWLNDGDGEFSLAHFEALPGATRLAARDFDGDGDVDIAVACNFADFARRPDASFVFFENQGGRGFDFSARTTEAARDGRWLVMETLDYDSDGDEDLVLGSFTLNPAPVPKAVATRWKDSGTDVLILENVRF